MSAVHLMDAVLEAARQAGRVALRGFGRGIAVEAKGDGSPVTEADRAAERAARAWISERFPDDGILGEEFGLERGEAPLVPIVEEAGGVFTDWEGGRGFRGGSAIATNAALAEEVRRALRAGVPTS